MSCYAYGGVSDIKSRLWDMERDLSHKFSDVHKKIDAQAMKPPPIVENFIKAGKSETYEADGQTAFYLKAATSGVIRMYEMDFSLGMATISTVQHNTITATETKKISEMPSKFVQKCQAVLDTQNNRKPRSIKRQRNR